MYSRGWRKVAVVANNGAYGLGLAQNFQVAVQQLNMTLLANIPFVDGITDFSTTVASLKASGARVVFIAMYNLPDAVYFMREAKKQGMVGPEYQYIGPDGVWPVYEDLKANQTGAESDWDNFQGVIAFTQNDQSSTATFKELDKWYMSNYNMTVPVSVRKRIDIET
jgi:ABC-type branched-subunit amino acid transport system substrate-binding protein